MFFEHVKMLRFSVMCRLKGWISVRGYNIKLVQNKTIMSMGSSHKTWKQHVCVCVLNYVQPKMRLCVIVVVEQGEPGKPGPRGEAVSLILSFFNISKSPCIQYKHY